VTPYLEVRTLPPGPRWPAAVVVALLVLPVGALLPGSTTSAALRALAMLAIILLAPLLGLSLARPRQTVTVDAEAGTIVRRTAGALHHVRARVEEWPLSAAHHVELEDLGTPVFPEFGVRIDFEGSEALELRAYTERDLAQDTVDHLVLLGIPGHSRAESREAELTAVPPSVWL